MVHRFFFSVLLLACPLGLGGQEFWECDDCCQGYSRVYLGPQVYHTTLSIKNTDSTIGGVLGLENEDTHPSGTMYGVNGGYEYKKPWSLYANVDLNYGQGKLKHHDALTRYVHEYDVAAVVGYQVGGAECDVWSFTPYVGLGYLRQSHNLTSFHVTYRYSIVQLPIGIKADYAFCALCSDWTVGLNVAVIPQIDSKVKINLLQGAYWSLAKRTDWLVSLPIEYFCNCYPLSVKLDLFWKKVGFGGSKAVTPSGLALGLPPMKWNAYGASLDLVWEF